MNFNKRAPLNQVNENSSWAEWEQQMSGEKQDDLFEQADNLSEIDSTVKLDFVLLKDLQPDNSWNSRRQSQHSEPQFILEDDELFESIQESSKGKYVFLED